MKRAAGEKRIGQSKKRHKSCKSTMKNAGQNGRQNAENGKENRKAGQCGRRDRATTLAILDPPHQPRIARVWIRKSHELAEKAGRQRTEFEAAGGRAPHMSGW
jgi:hypothetical protein